MNIAHAFIRILNIAGWEPHWGFELNRIDQNLNLYLACKTEFLLNSLAFPIALFAFLAQVASQVKLSFEQPLLLLHHRAIAYAVSLKC